MRRGRAHQRGRPDPGHRLERHRCIPLYHVARCRDHGSPLSVERRACAVQSRSSPVLRSLSHASAAAAAAEPATASSSFVISVSHRHLPLTPPLPSLPLLALSHTRVPHPRTPDTKHFYLNDDKFSKTVNDTSNAAERRVGSSHLSNRMCSVIVIVIVVVAAAAGARWCLQGAPSEPRGLVLETPDALPPLRTAPSLPHCHERVSCNQTHHTHSH